MEQIAPGDDSHDVAPTQHRHPPGIGAAQESGQLGEGRVLGAGDDLGTHHALHRRMRKAVSDRLVEVLARDLPAEPLRVADKDPALAVALAQHHRLCDRVVGAHEARGAGHDLRRRPERASGPRKGGEDELARLRERARVHGRGGLLMPAAAQHRGDRGRVELGQARAHDAEDAAVHLHEADKGQRVGEIDDLVRPGWRRRRRRPATKRRS